MLVLQEFEYRRTFGLTYKEYLEEPLENFIVNIEIMSIKNDIEANQAKRKVVK